MSTSAATVGTEVKSTTTDGEREAPVLPPGAWDCHHHIYDPKTFPYAPDRHLTPPPALIPAYTAFKSNLNITNSVLTPGLSYGSDSTSLLSFLSSLQSTTSASPSTVTRAVIVLQDPTSHDLPTLQELHTLGIRGVRLNLYAHNATHDVAKQITLLKEAAPRIAPLGWCLNFLPQNGANWADLEAIIPHLSVPVVTDHFAILKGYSRLSHSLPTTNGSPESQLSAIKKQAGMQSILNLLKAGYIYVKLSAPYRASALAPGYADLEPLVRLLVDANPDRILWASDWPHTPQLKARSKEEALRECEYLHVDDGAWVRALRGWVSEDEWEKIMVGNPGRLYGW